MKLTIAPATCRNADLDVLREAGWTEEQLFSAVSVASFFNYINRMADALGVDLEPEMAGRERFPPWNR